MADHRVIDDPLQSADRILENGRPCELPDGPRDRAEQSNGRNVAIGSSLAARRPPALRVSARSKILSQLQLQTMRWMERRGSSNFRIIATPNSGLLNSVRLPHRFECTPDVRVREDDGRLALERFEIPAGERLAVLGGREQALDLVDESAAVRFGCGESASIVSSMRTTSSDRGCSQANQGSLMTS